MSKSQFQAEIMIMSHKSMLRVIIITSFYFGCCRQNARIWLIVYGKWYTVLCIIPHSLGIQTENKMRKNKMEL